MFVSLPETYTKTDKSYPVLYIVDANFAIGSATEIVRLGSQGEYELPEMIIVGIGYALKELNEVTALRYRDLTPTDIGPDAYEANRRAELEKPPYLGSGQAGKLLGFIREELMPVINAEYRTKPADSTLWGDSLGGLFGLYALFHHPESFQRYVIGSPSIWWDHEVTFQYEEDYAKSHTDLKARVFMMVGGEEEPEHIPALAAFGMVRNVLRLDGLLKSRSYPSLELTTYIFEGETHSSVFTMGIARGLRAVYRDEVKGVEAYFEEAKT
jgi:predicted alpha/beta superfamily hydrolase